ncbi:MAG: TetR/AcrR family transcriptional regulator [Chloroflexota bacterium]
MSEDVNLRRKPRQARSQQRVDQLLNTAETLFAELGYEVVTTNLIASRAGVPIGSLYQFFPNKEALLDGLIERYVTELRSTLDSTLSAEAVSRLTVTALVSAIIDGIAAFEASHAGFNTIFLSSSVTVQHSQAVNAIHTEIVERVDAVFAIHYPALDPDRRHTTAVISVAVVKGLMSLAESADDLPPEQIIAEMKTVLLAYLRSVLVSVGLPLPPDLV